MLRSLPLTRSSLQTPTITMNAYQGHVVHVGTYLNAACDGAAAALRGQVDALQAQGTRVSVWQFEVGIDEVHSTSLESGVTVHRIPRFRQPLLAAMAAPEAARRWIAGQLPQVNFFHLHSVFSPQNNFVTRLGVPYGVTPQGGWSRQVLKGRRAAAKTVWVALFEKGLWAEASFIQAVSNAEERELKQLPKIGRLEFIPNGVNIPLPATNIPKRAPYFLFLGRLAVEQKGLDLLVNAYGAARREHKCLPDLLIAGPDYRGGGAALEALIGRLRLGDKVQLIGPVFGEAKNQLLAGAYVFVHPSRWEGMPLSILEALAQGTPCLVSQATGLSEWVEARSCGWSVGLGAPDLAKELVRLTSGENDVRAKARHACSSVTSDYSWANIADQLNNLYGRVPSESR
jgi:glycosyltransferase involved in cell wall biosynthesis